MYQHLHRIFRVAPQGKVTMGSGKSRTAPGFTIVELLVVIVVIGILAAITIVAYTGISQKAVASALQSDLANASTRLKMFQVENSAYPTANKCPTPGVTEICLKLSTGNTFVGYSANNQSNPQTFLLIVSNSSLAYKITNNSAPTQLASTMQPGVTPGAVLELHAAKANNGTSPGINSPLTTTWKDTSGNGNNGTLTGFAGTTSSGWAGDGSVGDPYRLVFDQGDDSVTVFPVNGVSALPVSMEAWFRKEPDPGWDGTTWVMIYGTLGGLISEGDINYALIRGTGGDGYKLVVGNEVWDSQTHHLVMTLDDNLSLYVDGSLAGSVDASTGFVPDPLGVITLGAGDWPGGISLARIYPFALTPAQVSANYNAGSDW